MISLMEKREFLDFSSNHASNAALLESDGTHCVFVVHQEPFYELKSEIWIPKDILNKKMSEIFDKYEILES